VATGFLAWIRRSFANPAWRFLALFAIYLGAVGTLLPIGIRTFPGVNQALITATAAIEYALVAPFSDQAALTRTVVQFGSFGIEIIGECTGLFEMAIYAACVLAFPTSWRNRGIGLLYGIPAIYAFNIVRILCLIIVGRYANSSFEFFHLYFWQGTLILMITSIWMLWIYMVVRDETDSSLPG
jgi:archaeosortase B (VPXXXP-CTERM-specific)